MKNQDLFPSELPYAKNFKSGFVSIVGRPSSGKSTLLNALCQEKVSITSALPQTTRNKIRGIVNRSETDNLKTPYGQLVFLDTPGFHLSQKNFNQTMMENVKESLEESDIILYLMDASRPPGEEERELAKMIASLKNKKILSVLNKVDLNANFKEDYQNLLKEEGLPLISHFISSLQNIGIETLITNLLDLAPEGEPFYPEDFYTDQEPSFRISEIIREKAINLLKEEIPYSIFVEVSDLERKEEGTLWARCFLMVESDSQKGIVIGKGGEMIRTIRNLAQKELKSIMGQKIYLDLRVKVFPKWQTRKDLIRKILR